MVTLEYVQNEYPLHWHVWNNNFENLKEELSKKIVSLRI